MPSETLHVIRAVYSASAVRMDQYPDRDQDFAEIAFIGRSNVGKSSLLNSLCNRNSLARISGTPGKTQTINFYRLTAKLTEQERHDFFLVDLPGYGYARTGRDSRRQWAKFIEEYLAKSPRLKLVCLLIDIRHSPPDSDVTAYRRLMEQQIPVCVVATKADKIARMAIKKNLDTIKRTLGMNDDRLVPYSSLKGTGREDLLTLLRPFVLS